jgi:hypothetical protein
MLGRAALLGGLGDARVSGHYSRSRSSASDAVGEGVMDKIMSHLGKEICPDGRACRLCGRKDNSFDEVQQANGVKCYIWWGKPPDARGVTQGSHCGYCLKFFMAQVRPVCNISVKQYEEFIGAEEGRLEMHQAALGQTTILIQMFLQLLLWKLAPPRPRSHCLPALPRRHRWQSFSYT